ncbi:MAG: hypothetical protein EOO07_22590 [Chitinophagaceae bacterium]|nr:MAG: hypothetical protein EOO07_22590 [Chitinophagaceae bacterium]
MKKICAFFLLSLFISCSSKNENKDVVKSYFDLEGYFTKEAERLSKTNPSVNKTVVVNGKAEEKQLKIGDWKTELQSFIGSDINKASWKGEFNTQESDSSLVYTANNAKIPIKSVTVTLQNRQPKSIKVISQNENTLYNSHDTLVYEADSFYQIIKSQKIKLTEEKRYQVIGKFK